MPFLKISRDRRGYEYFCLMHVFAGARGKPRPQTLYWFRSPPNLKVGREVLDPDVMTRLEARHPDITFDWDALRRTPMPPPSPEYWRERRRADRAMRDFHAAEDSAAADEVAAEPESVFPRSEPSGTVEARSPAPSDSGSPDAPNVAGPSGPGPGSMPPRDSRRRRRRRRHRGHSGPERSLERPQSGQAVDGPFSSIHQDLEGPAAPNLDADEEPEET